MNNNITIHILLNPVAGNGKALKTFSKLKKLLIQRKIRNYLYSSSRPGDLTEIAKKYSDQEHNKKKILLVIGGDGSLNEVVNGIKRSNHPETPVSYLPAGSGNDFARAAKLTNNPEVLLANLVKQKKPEMVDCGSFIDNDLNTSRTYFVNNFGIGFDAYIVNRTNTHSLKRKLNKIHVGNLTYIINVFNALKNQDTFSVSVFDYQGEKHFDNVYFTTTTNHPYFGGGVPILPSANIYNHRLSTIVVQKPSLGKFLRLFAKLFKDGSHVNDPHFHCIEAKEIRVKTYNKEYCQIDGENGPKTTYDISFKIDHFYLQK